VVQDLHIELHNTRFRLARWRTAEGVYLKGQLPAAVQDHHFGPHLRSYVLYPYYHQHVTQPLLLQQLYAFGVDLSSGQLSRLLTEGHAGFQAEAVLRAGQEVSRSLNVDDPSARHQGKNGDCLYLGSAYFAWYQSDLTKDRWNFITVWWRASPGLPRRCRGGGVSAGPRGEPVAHRALHLPGGDAPVGRGELGGVAEGPGHPQGRGSALGERSGAPGQPGSAGLA
jgi:hypothetical protein